MNQVVQREQWGSRAGFILASLGGAVGLGNIWRFSYVAGENGGGAFLLVYLVFVVALGLPLLLAELAIGRQAQTDVVDAFGKLGGSGKWRVAGAVAMIAALVILSYYAVVAGWAYKYLADYVFGRPSGLTQAALAADFRAFQARAPEVIGWQFAVLASTVVVVLAGVQQGIERVNKLLMPLLALVVLGLAGYSLLLEGGGDGLRFLFAPDWSALMHPQVYVAALGQALFSIGVGLGVLITYGSYMSRSTRAAPSALIIVGGDTLFAIVAGIAIFPAVFAFGIDPAQGPALAFVTLPQVFAKMPGGAWFGLAFFLLLSVAALTSAVSLLEVPVAFAVARFGISRRTAALSIGAAVFLAGVPSALGSGPWADVRLFGMPILSAVDHLASNILLPLGGLMLAIFTGWVWSREKALEAASLGATALGRLWLFSLRYVCPICIVIIVLRSILK